MHCQPLEQQLLLEQTGAKNVVDGWAGQLRYGKIPLGCHLYWLALGLDDRVLQSSEFLESCIFGFLDLRSLYFFNFSVCIPVV